MQAKPISGKSHVSLTVSIFSYVFGLGRRSRPPFPHCFSTDFQNSMIEVGNVNRPLLLQPDERLLRANLFTAMRP